MPAGKRNLLGGGSITRISCRGTSGFVTCRTTSGFVLLLGASNPIGGGTSDVVLSRRVSGFVRDGASSDIVRDRPSSFFSAGLVASVLARCRGVSPDGPLGRSKS